MSNFINIPWGGWGNAKQIGQGSFGTVYEIERTIGGIQEKAAMKVISIPKNESEINELYADGYNNESVTARYRSQYDSIIREYSLMAKMKGNGNIVYCDDIQSIPHANGIGWDIYIKMELLTPLTTYLGTSLQIPDAAVINIGMDICNALSVCEENGVLHRDIKPQNIFVAKDGRYKLGDFGVAKLSDHTTNATVVGTYRYMAPEVAREEPYSAAADRYSLGIVLYWLLNERRTPFLPLPPSMVSEEQDKLARVRRFRGDSVPAPKHGSDWLKQIVLKALSFDPRFRFSSASEMRKALEALKNGDYAKLNACLTQTAPIIQDEAEQTVGRAPGAELTNSSNSNGTIDGQDGTVGRRWPTSYSDGTKDGTVGRYIPKPQPQKKKRSAGFYVIIGLVAVLWVAAIFVVVKLIQNKRHETSVNDTTDSNEIIDSDSTISPYDTDVDSIISSENTPTISGVNDANETYYSLYAEFVSKIPIDEDGGNPAQYYLARTDYSSVIRFLYLSQIVVFDADGNGIPELLLGGKDGTGGSYFFVFTIEDGKVRFAETGINDLPMDEYNDEKQLIIYKESSTQKTLVVSIGKHATWDGKGYGFIAHTIPGTTSYDGSSILDYNFDSTGEPYSWLVGRQTCDKQTYEAAVESFYSDKEELYVVVCTPLGDNVQESFDIAFQAFASNNWGN